LQTGLDACPGCGAARPDFRPNGGKIQTVRDVPHDGHPVLVRFRRQCYRCLRCGKSAQQPLPGVDRGRKLTRRLVELAEREAFDRSSTFISTARRLGLNDRTVRNIFTERALRLESSSRVETKPRMGFDGVYVGGKERCVVTDLDTGRFVEILPECNYEALLKFLVLLPERDRVEVAAADMCPYIARALRRGLPSATRVVDTFHVQWLANKEMNAILRRSRVKVRNKTGRQCADAQEGAKKVARTRFLLNRRRGRLTEREVEELLKWRKEVPVLDTAYKLKEGFLNVWLSPDRAHAEAMYDRWELRAQKLLPKAFRKLRASMRKLRWEIFNYFDTGRATNACTEARNNVVKTLQRAGRGYDFHVLRAKLLYGPEETGQGITARRPRKPKARRAPRPANPRANGERLRLAYEKRQGAGLPHRPVPNAEWLRRFAHLLASETVSETTSPISARKDRNGTGVQKHLFPEPRRATPQPARQPSTGQQQLFQ
jgi:transposase